MDWRYLLTQYKWHIFLALLALALYIIFLTPSSPYGGMFDIPADPYTTCLTYCYLVESQGYNTFEDASAALKSSDFCREQEPYDSITGNCVQFIGECEVALVNGTTVMVGCD